MCREIKRDERICKQTEAVCTSLSLLFISFLLSPSARQNVTFNMHNKLLSPIPQSSLVPDDEQAVRGHPATRSISKHPPVLCGSDLKTLPAHVVPCRPRPRPRCHRGLQLPTFSGLQESSLLRSAQQFYEFCFYELHLLIFLVFLPPPHFISVGCPAGNRRA